jgi:hypothetical protein
MRHFNIHKYQIWLCIPDDFDRSIYTVRCPHYRHLWTIVLQ